MKTKQSEKIPGVRRNNLKEKNTGERHKEKRICRTNIKTKKIDRKKQLEYSLIQTSKRERKNSWKRNKYKNKAKTTRIQSNKKKVKNLEYSQIKRQKKLEYRQIKKTEKSWNTDN